MGILARAGCRTGRNDAGHAMNPGGFFEPPEHAAFLARVYPEHFPRVAPPPPLSLLEQAAGREAEAYADLLDAMAGGTGPVAAKGPRMLSVPLLHRLRETGAREVRAIRLERAFEDQLASILRVWRTVGDARQRSASEDFVRAYLEEWLAFGREVEARFPLGYIRVQFESLMADPVGTTARVAEAAGLPCPDADTVRAWVDPALANRAALPDGGGPTRGETALARVRRALGRLFRGGGV
jgi:hypothetical protein